MPRASVERTVAAPAGPVWSLVREPGRLGEWWPGVERVEGAARSRWTLVFRSAKGRAVRADYRLVDEDQATRTREWAQELEGTPFARVFAEHRTTVVVDGDGGATRVRLEERSRLRGVNRMGGFMVARARRKVLREALDAIEALVGESRGAS